MPAPSFLLPLLLQSVILPFAVASAVLLTMKKQAALAVALGLIAGYAAVFHDQFSFPPHQALDWLPVIALIALAAGTAAEKTEGASARLVARLLTALAVAALATWPALASLGWQKMVLVTLVSGGLIATTWGAAARSAGSAHSTHSTAAPLFLVIVAGGAGISLMLDASLLLGQLCGALAIAIAACAALALLRPEASFGAPACGIATVLLGALLINAYVYAGFSFGYVLLLAGGLAAGAAAARFARLQGRAGSLVAAGLALVPVATAVGLVFIKAQESGGY